MTHVARLQTPTASTPLSFGFVKRHPVLTYYALVFAISWGGILLIVGGPGAVPGTPEQVASLFPFVLLALFAGPSVAGVLSTALVDGKTGLRELRDRLLRWRVGARWYAVALLPAPLLVTAVLVVLSLVSPEFVPGILTTDDKVGLLAMGVGWALIGGGLLEELGWTGFATPHLRRRHTAFTTAMIVGVLWGVWHFLIAYWAGGTLSGGQSLPAWVAGILFFYLGALPAYRVLIVRVYDETGSLLVAMLMHASLSASTLILQPLATGVPVMVWNLAIAAVLWIVVAAVAVAGRSEVARPTLRPREA
jgi:membrane protease YdiL (CAAX protease family)